jgi:hypothetical protein
VNKASYSSYHRSQLLLLLLAAPATLLLSQGQAKAILNVRIFDDGPNLKVTVEGSISGSKDAQAVSSACGFTGVLSGQFNATFRSIICIRDDGLIGFFAATINGRSLASEGFTARCLVGTWAIDGTNESINVFIGSDT